MLTFLSVKIRVDDNDGEVVDRLLERLKKTPHAGAFASGGDLEMNRVDIDA